MRARVLKLGADALEGLRGGRGELHAAHRARLAESGGNEALGAEHIVGYLGDPSEQPAGAEGGRRRKDDPGGVVLPRARDDDEAAGRDHAVNGDGDSRRGVVDREPPLGAHVALEFGAHHQLLQEDRQLGAAAARQPNVEGGGGGALVLP